MPVFKEWIMMKKVLTLMSMTGNKITMRKKTMTPTITNTKKLIQTSQPILYKNQTNFRFPPETKEEQEMVFEEAEENAE